MKYLAATIALLIGALLYSLPAPQDRVGPQPGGGFLLSTGLVVEPAGRQIALDTFPMASALTPDGKFLLVLHGGYLPPSIAVLDAASLSEVSRVALKDAWLGLAISPNGRLVYASGGSRGEVHELTLSPEGKIAPSRVFTVIANPTHKDFIGDVKLSPDGRLVYAAGLYLDTIFVINPQSGMVIERFKTGRRPYRILFHPDGKSFFASMWADAAVWHMKADNGERLSLTRVGAHATDMVWRDNKADDEETEDTAVKARIFVTAGNTNNVYVLGVTEGKDVRNIETINLSLYPRQPAGMTPTAVALSEDQSRLYAVCADANAVAAVGVSTAKSRVLGFIPTGWYPIANRVMPDGRLLVFNGRGLGSKANPRGPNPTRKAAVSHLGVREDQYVGILQTGSASVIDPYTPEQLIKWTKAVMNNMTFTPRKLEAAHLETGNPIPSRPGDPSPIEHVIYIVKENRTYDQVLGDLGKGNSDPSLTLFKEDSSPNHHKLAREFVLLDNFYVNADVSADGHNWTVAGIAPDYVQRMWQNSYAGRRKHYDYEGGEPAATPPAGNIWNNVLAKGLPMRNYGYYATMKAKAGQDGIQVEALRDPALAPHTDMRYRPFDLDYTDVDRAKEFIRDISSMDKLPRFMILRLGNDHTSGTAVGKVAPLAAMADNDYALGMIVEAVSKSKHWPKTAIFVLEDDAQNGPDHVDSHRSPAFVISPYVRRGAIDSTMYNTTSMLRTIELILGLNPMTTYDAGARPMTASFKAEADAAPYTAATPRIPLDTRNGANAVAAAASAKMNFAEADDVDDDELNEILWRAIRGTEPPAPVRSYFGK